MGGITYISNAGLWHGVQISLALHDEIDRMGLNGENGFSDVDRGHTYPLHL